MNTIPSSNLICDDFHTVLSELEFHNLIHAQLGITTIHGAVIQYQENFLDVTTHLLHPEEIQRGNGAKSLKRRAEFLAGRCLARCLLGQTQESGCIPVLSDPIGRPLWPSSISASLSHTSPRLICFAHTSEIENYRIGCDIQAIRHLELPLKKRILAPTESLDPLERKGLFHPLLRLFSAKEAVYKAISLELGEVGFHPRRISLHYREDGIFEATKVYENSLPYVRISVISEEISYNMTENHNNSSNNTSGNGTFILSLAVVQKK
ncbi:MAG: 4'-phosphopantetheinyl transferase superfamily protein [Bdellovibrionales bacterium]|nr:4'-phosphopantetheinyl transferase superfamily protein [Bdellovibrionales bacterium]